ncbi:hypothetical protein BZL30_5238 [Mycobacterium kansasii]|uniref:Uncharacterized protein n=1 Tax=Mycobacterium kansasii TaxID=1768 RepID=A0A1V3XF10_MYCKA|nr:hypothetical protein BZL30_5238 [Mycobacterium kansasii]OOK77336.1 hypothetical protein BZL29_3576 [Mycobacterium kansasii]
MTPAAEPGARTAAGAGRRRSRRRRSHEFPWHKCEPVPARMLARRTARSFATPVYAVLDDALPTDAASRR